MTTALSSLDGVDNVEVDFDAKLATVTMKPGAELNQDAAAAAIRQGGTDSGNEFKLTSFKQRP